MFNCWKFLLKLRSRQKSWFIHCRERMNVPILLLLCDKHVFSLKLQMNPKFVAQKVKIKDDFIRIFLTSRKFLFFPASPPPA